MPALHRLHRLHTFVSVHKKDNGSRDSNQYHSITLVRRIVCQCVAICHSKHLHHLDNCREDVECDQINVVVEHQDALPGQLCCSHHTCVTGLRQVQMLKFQMDHAADCSRILAMLICRFPGRQPGEPLLRSRRGAPPHMGAPQG